MTRMIIGLVAISALISPTVHAVDNSISGRVGTLGIGGEVDFRFNQRFGARIQLNGLSVSYDTTESDIRYDLGLALQTFGVLADWYPTGHRFRLTAGLYHNGSELVGIAATQTSYTIGNTSYTPADIGTLRASIGFESAAWYLGIGYARIPEGSGWGWNFDLGALFSGEPIPALESQGGLLSSSAQLQNDIQLEEQQLQDDMSDFDVYPVITLGISYSF